MKFTYKTQSTLDYYSWCRMAFGSLQNLERMYGRGDDWYKWSRSRGSLTHLRLQKRKAKAKRTGSFPTWESTLKKHVNWLRRKERSHESDEWSKWSQRADTINHNIQTHRKGYGQEAQATD